MQNKVKRDKYKYRKDIKQKADWYKPTIAQQPIISEDIDEENNCVETNEDEIRKKGI